ncbi:MAG: hypothetical protein C4560_02215 [Nitrospiraceae bacterium]|nr:MAG: hypothetical protein C4560_02215 [Nitrospiraceae bacterium]
MGPLINNFKLQKETVMYRKIFILTILCLIIVPFTAASAEYKTGDMEFTLSGSGTSDNSFDNTIFSADIGLGYFYSKYLEGVFRQNVAVVDIPGGSDWNGSTRVGADFNIDLENWRPFLGVTVGYLYGESVEESFIAGPEAGIKAFVNDTTFILISVGYDFLFDKAEEADEAFDDGRFIYNLGIGFKW